MHIHDSEYEEATDPYLVEFDNKTDERGYLKVIDFKDIPFKIRRFFIISVRDASFERGHHAHKECWQALFPSKGQCTVTIQNIKDEYTFKVSQNQILIVPPYNWCAVRFDSHSTLVNVFASHSYDKSDYILTRPSSNSK